MTLRLHVRDPHQPKGMPVDADLRAEILAAVAALGETETRIRLGLSRHAFARVVAGLPVYAGTRSLIRERTASLRSTKESEPTAA